MDKEMMRIAVVGAAQGSTFEEAAAVAAGSG